jgi:hypothetical protein
MFKLIFKTISIITFIFIMVVVVAIWKGGEPFRIAGEKTIVFGEGMKGFADIVDDLLDRKEEVRETVKHLKETIDKVDNVTGNKTENVTDKKDSSTDQDNGPVNKDKETE